MVHPGRVPVVINRCYGGFSLSKAALNAYECEGGADALSYEGRGVSRTDRLLASVCTRLKENANGRCAKLDVFWVEERFEDYVQISEYDGYESLSVDFDRYKLHSIQRIIMDLDCSSDEKLERINGVFKEDGPTFLNSSGVSVIVSAL